MLFFIKHDSKPLSYLILCEKIKSFLKKKTIIILAVFFAVLICFLYWRIFIYIPDEEAILGTCNRDTEFYDCQGFTWMTFYLNGHTTWNTDLSTSYRFNDGKLMIHINDHDWEFEYSFGNNYNTLKIKRVYPEGAKKQVTNDKLVFNKAKI